MYRLLMVILLWTGSGAACQFVSETGGLPVDPMTGSPYAGMVSGEMTSQPPAVYMVQTSNDTLRRWMSIPAARQHDL